MNATLIRQANTPFFIVCILCLTFFASCTHREKNADNDIVFDTIQVNTTHYYRGDKNKLSCKLQLSYIYPKEMKDTDKLKKLQDFFNEKFFVDSIAAFPPKEAVTIYERQYLRNFDAEDFYGPDYEFEADELSYYQITKNNLVYNKNNFVSFYIESESFEGGAHGSKSIYAAVVNLNTGELLTENDFAGDDFEQNMSAVIVQKILEANELNSPDQLENLGFYGSEILPNGNFTLDEKGITYYFNEYEIAAYFVGVTKVFIPYEELKLYISGDSPISVLAGL